MKFKNIKNRIFELKNVILILGTILLCISGIFALNFNVAKNPSLEYELEMYTIRHKVYGTLPVRIDSTFYFPNLEHNWYLYSQKNNFKMPAIVFQHGFSCDKNFFKGLALEFVKRGFVCVCITSRGSHGSGGVLGMTYENEVLTAVDYLEALANIGFPIDMGRIGLVGHSMGAFSVTLAGSMDTRINATIAIAGPLANTTRGSPILDFLIKGDLSTNFHRLPLLAPGMMPYLQFPAGYLWEMASGNAVVEGKVNATNPNNYLNIIGTIDEAFSVFSAQEVLWYMLNTTYYDIPTYWQVKRNYLYGDFNGTARKLVTIPYTDHIFEPNHPATIYESISWMEKSMKLEHPIYGSIDYWIYQVLFRDSIGEMLRVSSPYLAMISVLLLFLPVSIYLGNWLKSKYTEMKTAREIENKKMWLQFLIYGIAFILISLITWPIVQAMRITPFTDFLGSNLLFMFLVVQSVLFLPVLIGLILYERWKFKESWEDFGIHPKAFPKSAIFGVLMSLFMYVILNVIITPNYFIISIEKPVSFMETFLYMLFVMSVTLIFFLGLIQSKLSRYRDVPLKFVSRFLPSWKELLLSSLITGIIQGVSFGILFSMFLASTTLVPLVTPLTLFGASIGLFFLISLINNWLYRKQRNVLGIIIFNAFFFSWISMLLPAVSGSII
ncbi:MAG: alpha/beta hydrolase family protein [Candidatus Helarchaeota archaeon]